MNGVGAYRPNLTPITAAANENRYFAVRGGSVNDMETTNATPTTARTTARELTGAELVRLARRSTG